MKPQRVHRIMRSIRFQDAVIGKIKHPAEKKTWDWYKNYFLTKKRIQAGIVYWKKHRTILNTARRRYGVNPSVIVAIAGVETFYGTHQGEHNMLNAIATLAFQYPSRAAFFQKELASYFILDKKMPLKHVKSSYAGAIGLPQFMPSSYLYYSISNKPHHTPNLLTNNNDAILSIANYLSKNGWQRNQFIIFPTHTRHKPKASWFAKSANRSIGWYQKHGVKVAWPIKPTQAAAMIKLNTKKESPYWLALPNFYSILRYNPRTNYAMAVYQLSRALQKQIHHDKKHL